MIRDRGRIKWNSLMLPEHVTMLRGWAAEEAHEQQKQLDEQKLEQLNEIANEAMAFGKEVTIVYFSNSQYEEIIGKIHSFDALKREFRMVDQAGATQWVAIESIEQINLWD